MSSPRTDSWGRQLASLGGLVTKPTRQGRRYLASPGGLLVTRPTHGRRRFASLGGLVTRLMHGVDGLSQEAVWLSE